jgi:hypothetical protein
LLSEGSVERGEDKRRGWTAGLGIVRDKVEMKTWPDEAASLKAGDRRWAFVLDMASLELLRSSCKNDGDSSEEGQAHDDHVGESKPIHEDDEVSRSVLAEELGEASLNGGKEERGQGGKKERITSQLR